MCTLGKTTPTCAFDKGNHNFFRLQKLLIDGGREALLNSFVSRANHTGGPQHYVNQHLATLQSLKKKNIITNDQWILLCPKVDTTKWDISLLCLLFRNIGQVPKPINGWEPFPDSTDQSFAADIVRLRHYRNRLIGHASHTRIFDPEFSTMWAEISAAILRIDNSLLTLVNHIYHAKFDDAESNTLALVLSQWITLEKVLDFDFFASSLTELSNKMSSIEQLVNEGNDVIAEKLQSIMTNFENRILQILEQKKNKQTNILQEQLTSISDETIGAICRMLCANKVDICAGIKQIFIDEDIRSLLEKIIDSIDLMMKDTALNLKALREHQSVVLSEFQKTDKQHYQHIYLSQEHFDLSKEHYETTKEAKWKMEKLFDFIKDEYERMKSNVTMPLQSHLTLVGRRESSLLVTMSCGDEYKIEALNSYCIARMQNGEESLRCYKCNTEWTMVELREHTEWTEQENQKVEVALSMNYINKNKDIKKCPSCLCFSTREDHTNVRVKCRLCSLDRKLGFEFCWECQKQWNGYGIVKCGNVGCVTESSTSRYKLAEKRLKYPSYTQSRTLTKRVNNPTPVVASGN